MMQKLNKWHDTKLGLLVFALVEWGLAYGFASLAVDHGSFFDYFLALVCLIGALQDSLKLIGKFIHGNKAR